VFAIIEAGGKQHRVSVGDVLEVDRMHVGVGDRVEHQRVLLLADGSDVKTGAAALKGVGVVSTVVAKARGPKVIVFHYKSKKRQRTKTGHRQELTRLRIDDIVVP
jgi:large subunit ribosomal protein L21